MKRLARLRPWQRAKFLVETPQRRLDGTALRLPSQCVDNPTLEAGDRGRPGVRKVRAVRPEAFGLDPSLRSLSGLGSPALATRGPLWGVLGLAKGPGTVWVGQSANGLGSARSMAAGPDGRDGLPPAGLGSVLPAAPGRLGAARRWDGAGTRRSTLRASRRLEMEEESPLRFIHRPEPWVFLILLASYGFFWHSRDWNSASRLMLTYALVDRGTVKLDGLDVQTGDKAFFRGHYYCDKLPGFSFLAIAPYALARRFIGLPRIP